MKISIHTMYFLPDFGSAPILINELASDLAAWGHNVEVVTTIPRQRSPELKGLFYSRRRENGFVVKRFWTNATPHPIGRLIAWNIYTGGTILNALTLRKGDILFLRTPPLQLGLTGFLAKRLRGAKVLLNVQDIHPDLSIESGILRNPAAIRFAQVLEKWVYRISDHIVVIGEGFLKNLLDKGVPRDKMSVIPNWVDTDFLKPIPKDNPVSRKYGLHDKFVVMYSGTISISSNRALEHVLEAAATLRENKDIVFAIIGEGLKKAELQKKADKIGTDNVQFLPFQPYGDLPHLLASSDVLLVPLDKEKSQMSVPSKLYNYLAAGRPVLGLAPPASEVAALIRGTRSGDVVPPDDVAGIGEAVLRLKGDPDVRREMASNARRYVVDNFARKTIMNRYETLLASLA
ncbi:MAG: glycosyltransferase family 4 protein [Candidatus Aminicenantes bacterium]|nr:glycosyltransferase family 4 protein [Candidatus Aminicenantes bacterium]